MVVKLAAYSHSKNGGAIAVFLFAYIKVCMQNGMN